MCHRYPARPKHLKNGQTVVKLLPLSMLQKLQDFREEACENGNVNMSIHFREHLG